MAGWGKCLARHKDELGSNSMDFNADGSTKITTRSRAHQQAQEGAAANPSSRDEASEQAPSVKCLGIFVRVKKMLVQLVDDFPVERAIITRTEHISIRAMKMLCQLVADFSVERVNVKFDMKI